MPAHGASVAVWYNRGVRGDSYPLWRSPYGLAVHLLSTPPCAGLFFMHKVINTESSVSVWLDGDGDTIATVLFSALTADGREAKAAQLATLLQAELDVRTPITDFPIGDPDRTDDPATDSRFVDGSDIVERHVIVTDAFWKPSLSTYYVTIEQVR